ncbi:NADPH:quinone reductase [Baekduia soli]|uniref:NADPH:quinone reductase n=1 Tax=Baekduia soli TaxID=496014 RepID=A0A5B8U4H0_9ACTN|nr:NADPH:quinone reductase [Baekduia soli]QEC47984.1 NADPH:quinone reductase [Baekduia soli]
MTTLPSTILAARYPASGDDAGTIRIDEIPRPVPGPGEVLVQIHVSGVNPTDWKARGGGLSAGNDPWVIPNQDGAGVVVAVGDGVDAGRVGERVWLYLARWQRPNGTATQYVALDAGLAVPLPEGIGFDVGAGLGIPAMTAHRCLFADGPLTGQRILVHGGAGAVGHAAIQLARWGGAEVAATVSSPEKAELATGAGAALVVNYREEDVAERVQAWAPGGVQRVIEVDLPGNLETDVAVIAPGATIMTYSVTQTAVLPPPGLLTKNAALAFMLVYTMPDEAKRQAVQDITQALRDDALGPLPFIRFALADTAAAHDAVEAAAVGKVVIDVPLA